MKFKIQVETEKETESELQNEDEIPFHDEINGNVTTSILGIGTKK